MTTNSDKTALSFGRYLQSIRIEKNISLKAVSQETRIRLETLQYIEEENHQQLPDEVFVKGFLRAYAKAVGADGEEAVRRYDSRLGVIRKITTSEAALKGTGTSFWRRLLLGLGAMGVLIAVTLVAVTQWRDRQTTGPEPPKEMALQKTQEVAGPPAASPEATTTVEPEPVAGNGTSAALETPVETAAPVIDMPTDAVRPPIAAKLRLNIDATEETWMKIVIDDHESKEYTLYPGDHIELEAVSGYSLLVGNAGGIRLFLDGKPVAVAGRSGQVVKIKLP